MYFGDNGAHEFWETEEPGNLLIFKNHGEKDWICTITIESNTISIQRDTKEKVIEKVEKHLGIKIKLDKSRVFEDRGKRQDMKLVKVKAPQLEASKVPRDALAEKEK
jgi:2-hydroxy-3-keto-5-methylthiopentenyl-1-phosphate phosphatase